MVLTRPIRFTAPRKYLFINAIGRVSVSVLDNRTNSVLHGLEGGLSCVSPLRGTALDSTKAAVGWAHGASCAPADLSALVERSVAEAEAHMRDHELETRRVQLIDRHRVPRHHLPRVTTATSPRPRHHCHVNTVTSPLPRQRYHATTAT